MNALSITPSRISIYHRKEFGEVVQKKINPFRTFVASGSEDQEENSEKPKKPIGVLSRNAKKRLQNATNWLMYLSTPRRVAFDKHRIIPNFRVSLVTLTLPSKQRHSHAEIKEKCLNYFLVMCRRKYGLKNYIWKAELQKNGNIHFHLIIDQPIHFMQLRATWNQAISVLGYIDDYCNNFKNLNYEQYKRRAGFKAGTSEETIRGAYAFGRKTSWKSPNSTDVQKVKNVRKLAAYLSKYVQKNLISENPTKEEKESLKGFTGRFWYCSSTLSRLGSVKLELTFALRSLFRSISELKGVYLAVFDFCRTAYFDFAKIPKKLARWLREELVSHAIRQRYPFPAPLD